MKRRYLFFSLLGLSLCGCQLNVNYDKVDIEASETLSVAEIEASTGNTEEETSAEQTTENDTSGEEVIVTLTSENQSATESETEETSGQHSFDDIPDMVLPTNANGEWLDNQIIINALFHHVFVTGEDGDFGENGVIYNIANYPNIAVKDNYEKQKEFNEKIVQYLYNKFYNRFQMYNIDIELTCVVHNEKSRFVSFENTGKVFHNGLDTRYEDEKEYRFYFTIDRMTLDKIGLETAYGIDRAVSDIKNGKYTVVSAKDSVFETFSNELLSKAYSEEPMFSDDTDHYLDYYFDDGKVCVCIWVGNEHGGYAVLKLKGDSELLKEKDKSVEETTEAAKELEETSEDESESTKASKK